MKLLLAVQMLLLCGSLAADDTVDSARAAIPQVIDTLLTDTLSVDTVASPLDTVTINSTTVKLPVRPVLIQPFSIYDTLVKHFTPWWLNIAPHVNRSFAHDASDFFRFHAPFYPMTYQTTPMRSTVRPYGLPGARIGVIANGMKFERNEFAVEPDGMLDLTDVPLSARNDLHVLPVGLGGIFGGEKLVTLLSEPSLIDTGAPKSSFLVDKGSYGYALTRGRYANRFQSGRILTLGIDYRTADGFFLGRGFDSYTYNGALFEPLGLHWGAVVSGYLVDSRGALAIRPDIGGATLISDRFDRKLNLEILRHNNRGSATTRVGYRHTRSGSALEGIYRNQLNWTGHSGTFAREWGNGPTAVVVNATLGATEFDQGGLKNLRHEGELSAAIVRHNSNTRWAARLSTEVVETFGLLPSVSLAWLHETSAHSFSLSALARQSAPEQLELHKVAQQAPLYQSGAELYADLGNPRLKEETIFAAAIDYALGKPTAFVGLSVAGGRILDGIEWIPSSDTSTRTFMPMNRNVSFVSTALKANLGWKEYATVFLSAGRSFSHYTDTSAVAYSPDYQATVAAELRYPWRQRKIELSAYGEGIFTGPYLGYSGREHGEVAIFNGSLAFQMGQFRFHFVVQNLFNNAFETREYFQTTGRFNYFGFVWHFLN